MKCCSRSTLGVIIGIINLILCTITIIACVVLLALGQNVKDINEQQKMALGWYNIVLIILIVMCIIYIIICSLLITGIVKKRHNLMLPWIILSGISFVCNCIRVVYEFFAFIVAGVNVGAILIFLFLSLLGIALSGFILLAIYNLYKDIKDQNNIKPYFNKA